MERERLLRENEEKEQAETAKKIKEQFDDPNSQWERDKTDIQNLAMLEKAKEQQESEGAASPITNPESATQDKTPSKEAVSGHFGCLAVMLYLTQYRQIRRGPMAQSD